MNNNSKIYVAGHLGMVGGAIVRRLKARGFDNIVVRSRKELDLNNQAAVEKFFATEKPEYVFLAAAKAGGIAANIKSPASFLYDNLAIQNNVIHNAYEHGVKKLIFLGSSCVYPRLAKQPMTEDMLLDGKLEPTNEGYAIAKIAGIKMCEFYKKQYGFNAVSVQPPNLFGEGDHFDLATSHVVAALMHRFYAARLNDVKEVELWGTGAARRELMYVDDAADACLFAAENDLAEPFYNAGTNEDISIYDLAHLIKDIVGYGGEIKFDHIHADGMPQKLMDSSKLNALGWQAEYSLHDALKKTYQYFLDTYAHNITKD